MKKRLFFLFCCSALLLTACGGSAATETAYDQLSSVGTSAAFSTENAPAETEPTVEPAMAQLPQAQTQAVAVEDGINYFSFHTDQKIYQNVQGQDLLMETFTEPEFYSQDTQLHDWVNMELSNIIKSEKKISMELLDFAEEEQARMGADFYIFSHYLTMGVGRHDNKVASVLTLSSVYSGGPHPSSVQSACNLDLKGLKILTLEDVLEENADQMLYDMVLEKVLEKFAAVGEDGLYPDYKTVLKDSLTFGIMTSHWYFNEKGLVIFFNQYVLAPYAAGIIKTELPYDSLHGLLKTEYMPEDDFGTAEGVQISQIPPGEDVIFFISFGSGATVYFSPEGKASQVQLSEVFFAGDTPVGESMLFSANYLDESVTIALQGDWTDDQTLYAIQYSDETGEDHVIYSTSADIWREIS